MCVGNRNMSMGCSVHKIAKAGGAGERAHKPLTTTPLCATKQESYAALNKKTLAFFGTAAKMFDTEYIVKVDDDAFVRLDRLSHAVDQWRRLGAGGLCSVSVAPLGQRLLLEGSVQKRRCYIHM